MARIIISIPDDLLTRIDEYAEKYSYNRSELLRYAIRKLIDKEHETTENKSAS